jgi:hypothetical protein
MTVRTGPRYTLNPYAHHHILQNSGCISIRMATSIPQRARLNGRLLRIISRATRPTCSSSMRASSRYDISRAGGCARPSMVRTYDAFGMDTDHQYHYPGLTQMEWGEKLLCQGFPCAVSCAPTTGRRGLVHLMLRVLQYSVSLSSSRRSSTSSPPKSLR